MRAAACSRRDREARGKNSARPAKPLPCDPCRHLRHSTILVLACDDASPNYLNADCMSLYTRFQDEAEFREELVKPLLNRLGYYGVSELHGTQEFGKDFVFSELHRLGGFRHYAAQVKHEKKIRQGASVDGLLSQVRQAFATPFKRADSPRECHVSAVYVFNSGEITDGAREYLLSAVGREHLGTTCISWTENALRRSMNGPHSRVMPMQERGYLVCGPRFNSSSRNFMKSLQQRSPACSPRFSAASSYI